MARSDPDARLARHPHDVQHLAARTLSYGSVGGLSLTSLPVVGAVLGAFYDVDNTPGGDVAAEKKDTSSAAAPKARIAAGKQAVEDLDDAEEAPAEKRQKR